MSLRQSVLSVAEAAHSATLALCLMLVAVLFAAQCAVVLMRYGLGVGFLELQDLVTYSFAALVCLSLPLALRFDRHVRVDVLRAELAPETNRWIDRGGLILFLIPVFALILWHAWPLVAYAWSIAEGSRETGGLPGLFLVKTCVPLAAALMILQGVAAALRRF